VGGVSANAGNSGQSGLPSTDAKSWRLAEDIGHDIAPADKMAGRAEIFAARDRKLAEARERRKEQREAARLRTVA